MKKSSYKAYSIACWVAWALIFIIRAVFNLGDNGHVVTYIFIGWVIGWLGGAIAHRLYR